MSGREKEKDQKVENDQECQKTASMNQFERAIENGDTIQVLDENMKTDDL